jgi:hypothetical protein
MPRCGRDPPSWANKHWKCFEFSTLFGSDGSDRSRGWCIIHQSRSCSFRGNASRCPGPGVRLPRAGGAHLRAPPESAGIPPVAARHAPLLPDQGQPSLRPSSVTLPASVPLWCNPRSSPERPHPAISRPQVSAEELHEIKVLSNPLRSPSARHPPSPGASRSVPPRPGKPSLRPPSVTLPASVPLWCNPACSPEPASRLSAARWLARNSYIKSISYRIPCVHLRRGIPPPAARHDPFYRDRRSALSGPRASPSLSLCLCGAIPGALRSRPPGDPPSPGNCRRVT